jgi:hypothetical protein
LEFLAVACAVHLLGSFEFLRSRRCITRAVIRQFEFNHCELMTA